MASPFRVFRKHQKVLIATLGVLAMVAFVFLPIVMQRIGDRSSANPVVVKTKKFGNLKEAELEFLRNRRLRVLHFLQRVRQAIEKPGMPAMAAQRMERAISPASEQNVVDTWLYAQYAGQLGVVVSDQAVNDFIRELTEDQLDPYELKTIFKSVGVNQFQFFDMLRHELLAIRLREMLGVSLAGTTPAQRWDYFTRLRQEASIEAVPISVEEFVDQVEEPDEKTLREFFEEHKEAFANPVSPEPGFQRPHKVAVRYFKADYEKFLEPDAVTDEQVREFYEQYKQLYDLMPPPELEGTTAEPTEQLEPPKEAVEPQAESGAPPQQPPGAGQDTPPEKSNHSSALPAASPFRLVSLVQDDTQQEATAEGEATAEAEAEATAEARAVAAENQLLAPEPVVADPDSPAGPKDPLAGALGEIIRTQVARQQAVEKIDQVFGRLADVMMQYSGKLAKYKAVKEMNEQATPPAKPDYKALAKEYGLTTGRLPLMSQLQAIDTDIGRSLVNGRDPFVYYAYRDEWPEHVTATSTDRDGNRYLFWKVEEVEAAVPKFDDQGVRRQVLRTWKMVQARTLAEQKARQLAGEARKAGTSLKQISADRPGSQVIETPPFSWMTRGNVPSMASPRPPPRLSEVEGIDLPGRDFMRTVFSMKAGDIGVAMNHPQTVAYVIRIVETNPLQNVLWEFFTTSPYTDYRDIAAVDQGEIYRAWDKELKTDAGLKWMRKADQQAERQ